MNSYRGPVTGDGTYDIIDDALSAQAARRGAWPGGDMTLIHLLTSLITQAGRCLPQAVTDARANGHTRHDLATLLATSPHQARLRSGPASPIAGSRWPIPGPDDPLP